MYSIPDHLVEQVTMILAKDRETSERKSLWAVILGLIPYKDGDEWCVLWGIDIQVGIVGFGKTPVQAIYAFEWAMEKSIKEQEFDVG